MSDLDLMAAKDNRPYPRPEICQCCRVNPVDVIGPGDTWAMCAPCHLALADEVKSTPTLSEMLRTEEEYMRAAEQHAVVLMTDPDTSDDAIADIVLDLRRAAKR